MWDPQQAVAAEGSADTTGFEDGVRGGSSRRLLPCLQLWGCARSQANACDLRSVYVCACVGSESASL